MIQARTAKAALLSSIVWLAVPAAGAAAPQVVPAPPGACDQACLANVMTDFLRAMTTGKPDRVALTDQAEVRENARVIVLNASVRPPASGPADVARRSRGARAAILPRVVHA